MQQRRLNQEEQADHAEDNPALSQVIERNIRTIIQAPGRLVRAACKTVSPTPSPIFPHSTQFSGKAPDTSPIPCNWEGMSPPWVISHTNHLT